jgi:hypothetical protein
MSLIKLKLKEIVDIEKDLELLSNTDLPTKVSYAVAKTLKGVKSELSIYHDQVAKLVQTFKPTFNENGTSMNFSTPEEKGRYLDNYNELVNTEVEIDVHKSSINDLGDLKIKPALLVDWLFD